MLLTNGGRGAAAEAVLGGIEDIFSLLRAVVIESSLDSVAVHHAKEGRGETD